MKYEPHEYQRYAINYIEDHPFAAVLLDMGLGKTSITLTAIADLLFDSFEVHKVLVIAPLRVARDTWSAELQKWDQLHHLTYSVAVGSEAERKAALTKKTDIYIINRENVQWLIEKSKQTIGVEVEMNGIPRRAAAKVAAGFFGTGRYEDTAHRNGYYTWSAWDAQGREWKFQRDVSIQGPDSEKCELVTPILTYGDIETLQELCRQLRHNGAKSDASRGCGVHIHIGANGHTPQTLRNLANIMASHESLIADALKLDSGRIRRYCRTVDPNFLRMVNAKKPKTMASLADIWYTSQGANYGRTQHYNDSRYHMLNYHATFTKGTVEFRLFQFDEPTAERKGGIHAGQIKSYIQLCLALSQRRRTCGRQAPSPSRTRTPSTR